jgi:hypothetical protein
VIEYRIDPEQEFPPPPPFMYGTHYSCATFVVNYLVRQEPFTTLHINLQGGKFDVPDRLFFNFGSTWANLNSSSSDVKECIPEMFCCPEFLVNSNKLPLGELQRDERVSGTQQFVNDVVLPPWAHNKPHEFIRLHREALESDYVSDNLHHWIDLVFGYKQTGEEAIKANNLFYYLTYENAVDIDLIPEKDRESTIVQVRNFGQTPSQLFTKAHLHRLPRKNCSPLICQHKIGLSTAELELYTFSSQLNKSKPAGAVVAVQSSKTQLIAYHSDLTVTYFKFSIGQDGMSFPHQARFEKAKENPCAPLSVHSMYSVKRVVYAEEENLNTAEGSYVDSEESLTKQQGVPLNDEVNRRSLLGKLGSLFGMPKAKLQHTTQGDLSEYLSAEAAARSTLNFNHVSLSVMDGGAGRVISCGYWDNTLRVHALDTLKEVASTSSGHIGAITCVQVDKQGGHIIITGGEDGTCRVWALESPTILPSFYESVKPKGVQDNFDNPNLVCVHVLCGQESPITALFYSADLDIVASGSQDGLICLHSAKRGEFIRTIYDLSGESIDLLFISSQGYLVAHSWTALKTWLLWINGEKIQIMSNPANSSEK